MGWQKGGGLVKLDQAALNSVKPVTGGPCTSVGLV